MNITKIHKNFTMIMAMVIITMVGLSIGCGGLESAAPTSAPTATPQQPTSAKPIQDLWLITTTQLPSQVAVGETFPATVQVKNRGNVAIETATLLMTLSANLTFVDSRPTGTIL